MTILIDGAFRTGIDVFKALALGADGVLIGRPFAYAVYGGGHQGVSLYLEKLRAELAEAMLMTGAGSIQEIERSKVDIRLERL
jgi:isopentenyl diphosphate isomerase/L-lactate dehydrogenase-like FMN-dependent dehydrogenase